MEAVKKYSQKIRNGLRCFARREDGLVTVEWVATGIHSGDLPGLPATNRPFTLRGVTVVIRENGKIVRESLYYDVTDLYRQLGRQK